MTDIKQRLAVSAQSPHSQIGSKLAGDALEYIKQLEQRLEIEPGIKYDGIDCRDETIKLLEARIEELKPKAARYDYLRSGEGHGQGQPFVAIYRGAFSRWTNEHCDDVVDAAIAAQSTNEQDKGKEGS